MGPGIVTGTRDCLAVSKSVLGSAFWEVLKLTTGTENEWECTKNPVGGVRDRAENVSIDKNTGRQQTGREMPAVKCYNCVTTGCCSPTLVPTPTVCRLRPDS